VNVGKIAATSNVSGNPIELARTLGNFLAEKGGVERSKGKCARCPFVSARSELFKKKGH